MTKWSNPGLNQFFLHTAPSDGRSGKCSIWHFCVGPIVFFLAVEVSTWLWPSSNQVKFRQLLMMKGKRRLSVTTPCSPAIFPSIRHTLPPHFVTPPSLSTCPMASLHLSSEVIPLFSPNPARCSSFCLRLIHLWPSALATHTDLQLFLYTQTLSNLTACTHAHSHSDSTHAHT